MSVMSILIDGYNLLRAVQNLTEQTSDVTDVQLCFILSRYIGIVKTKGVIVFDGIGPRDKTAFGNLTSLEVVFSGRSKEADDIIEKLVLENSAPKSLTVVSSDRRLALRSSITLVLGLAQNSRSSTNLSQRVCAWAYR